MAIDPRSLFGFAVKQRRLELGLTQEQLAERSNLHWTYVSSIERGERNVSLLNIVKLAKALQTSTSSLTKNLP